MKKAFTVLTVAGLLGIGLGSKPWGPGPESHPDEPTLVFLVRHAEKVDASSDPALSEEGRLRSLDLSKSLVDAQIDHIHSTDFLRTRETARPTAEALGLEVKLYDPRRLPRLIQSIERVGGRHLVVGHSNTTPELVRLLGGDPGNSIDERDEYDRLYLVTRYPKGTVTTVLLRYGA